MQHPFRFCVVGGEFPGASAWREQARRMERLGYSTVLVRDGFAVGFDPLLVLAAAADATTTLRVGTYVINNDLRHPVLLAKGIATLDQLSGGRVEFGIGAGYRQTDYQMGAIEYDSAGVRISRMEEAIQLARQLLTQGSVDFIGKYVSVSSMPGLSTAQKPYPPIFIGGAASECCRSLRVRQTSSAFTA